MSDGYRGAETDGRDIARDIQNFEMPPLGPFNGKSFGTTISPWVVTRDALKPFSMRSTPQVDQVEGYLADPDSTAYAITMQVEILTQEGPPTVIGTSNVSSLYWNHRQMVVHATCSGSPLRTGDILATGTVSESGSDQRGCLLETTDGGKNAITLADGSERGYLRDEDVVRMTAMAGNESSGVGFGECIGAIKGRSVVNGQ
jgi:fumarylacetoacetase